jgi:hypothetical protein
MGKRRIRRTKRRISKRNRRHSRRKRGGFIGTALSQAVVPFSLIALNQKFKK